MRPTFLIALVLVACTPAATTPPGLRTVTVRAVAGPVCPVETVPPDPACEPHPVAGAPIFVMPADGRDVVVAQGTTDDDGLALLDVPPGAYIVTGGEVAGLMGLPSPTPVTVGSEPVSLVLAYDTGIR
ncbi:MAG TPA: hypothetical protein VJ975_10530 [Candidatus Limnocylindria bacterium]|nr:hypothetical protein [Candidatus Limnocylindria bacterium]